MSLNATPADPHPVSTLFELMPVGAYRSSPDGKQLRANKLLVRLNGYANEAEMLAAVNNIAAEWYVDPGRRAEFQALLEHDGQVTHFVSEIYRHRSRERIWVRENAHVMYDIKGKVLFYEGTVEDITDSQNARTALEASERRFRALTEKAQVITVVCRADGVITYASPAALALLGYAPEAWMGTQLYNWLHPDDVQTTRAEMALMVTRQNSGSETVLRFAHADGSWRFLAALGSNCLDESAVAGIVIHFRDISERASRAEAEMREHENRWKLALESTGDGVWDWYVQTGVEFYSAGCKALYGFASHEIADRADEFDARTHPDDLAQLLHDRQDHFDSITPTYRNQHRVRCKDGSWKWVLTRGMVICRDAQGLPLRMIGTHSDITVQKDAEALIWQQAHFDALTGLPNRRMLREQLDGAIAQAGQRSQTLAVLFIDLDHFKGVNDSFGHDHGDLLLIEAARRLQSCITGVYDTSCVARMGGDEFTVLVLNPGDAAAQTALLERMLLALSEPFDLTDERSAEQAFVSASIGITLCPQDATSAPSLLKNADQALYAAKAAGRNRYSYFTPELQVAADFRVQLISDLRSAVSDPSRMAEQFYVAYQPIVDLTTGAVTKAEALLRWQHPQRGAVSPALFIPLAEASGLINTIGAWVLQQAAQQVKQWRNTLSAQFQISVNKSPVQFHNDAGSISLVDNWLTQLSTLGLPGAALVIEITEGLLLDSSQRVTRQLQALREAGIGVSLDDFGTGYSSLTYLQKFTIDTLKIDQRFIRHLDHGSTDLALCQAIVVMAHALGMKVVAEGVETALQRDLLLAAGCDYAQGYLYAKPMPPAAFEAYHASL